METDLLAGRVQEIKQFFRHKRPQEWLRTLPSPPDDPVEAYRLEQFRLLKDLDALLPALVEAGHSSLVAELTRNSPTGLLRPLCRLLALAAYSPSVSQLVKEYRGAAPQCRAAILDVIRTTGALVGLSVALEGQTDSNQSVREVAVAALDAIRTADRTVAFLLDAAEGRLSSPLELAPETLTTHLVTALPLARSLSAFQRMSETLPDLAQEVRRELVRRIQVCGTERPAATVDASHQRPLLLLATQEEDGVPPEVRRQSIQAFHRAGREERLLVLQVASPKRGAQLLAFGLLPDGRKNLEQTVQHMEQDVPQLVVLLTEQLWQVAAVAASRMAARILVLLVQSAPDGWQVARAVPRRLWAYVAHPDLEEQRGELLTALLGSDAGVELLAGERLAPELWFELSMLLEAGPLRPRGTPLFRAVCDNLGRWAVLDDGALVWALNQIDRVDTDALADCVPLLSRAVAAQLTFGLADRFGPLLDALSEHPGLWLRLAPHVLPALLGAPAERLSGVLAWMNADERRTPAGVAEALDCSQNILGALLEEFVTFASADEWLNEHTRRPFYQAVLQAENERLRERTTMYRNRFAEEDQADRAALESGASELLDQLDESFAAHAESAPELARSLLEHVQEFANTLFAALDEPPFPVPDLVPPTGEPLFDYRQIQLVQQAVMRLFTDRGAVLRATLGERIGLPVEQLLLAIPEEAPATVTEPLARWIEAQGLQLVEARRGSWVRYQPHRHVLLQPDGRPDAVRVLTWGLAAADGSVLRKAVVAP